MVELTLPWVGGVVCVGVGVHMEEAQEQKPAKYHERSAGGKGGSPESRLWRWVVRDSGHFCRVFTKLWAWLRRRLPHPQLMLKREPPLDEEEGPTVYCCWYASLGLFIQAGSPGRDARKDPKHPKTPGYTTEGASQCFLNKYIEINK